MITSKAFDELRGELSIKSKNGVDFTLAASTLWLLIALIWTLDFKAYDKSVFTFMISGLMLPMAFLFSKLLKTNWANKSNPLQPLGLWLNFAQLFYFPFLVFMLLKMPEYFVMVYAIITGAHFFPYAWFFKTPYYAVFAGIVSIGSMILGLVLAEDKMYIIPAFTALSLLVLSALLYFDFKKKSIISYN